MSIRPQHENAFLSPSHAPSQTNLRVLRNSLIESIPLTLFLIYIHSQTLTPGRDWLTPYTMASVSALLITLFLYRQKTVLNRLFLGIHLYFFSGFIGLILKWHSLNNFYGYWGPLAMLGWIFALGIFTTFCTKNNFLGLPTRLRIGSFWMLGVCGISIFIAASFRNQLLLGEWLPFIILFSAYSLLRKRFLKCKYME
jgi:hypothetical protein